LERVQSALPKGFAWRGFTSTASYPASVRRRSSDR
jgi:hypothetical protein